MTGDVSRFEPPVCPCGHYAVPGHVCPPVWLRPVTDTPNRRKARAGDIGSDPREVEFEPFPEAAPAEPQHVPATPTPAPEPVPVGEAA